MVRDRRHLVDDSTSRPARASHRRQGPERCDATTADLLTSFVEYETAGQWETAHLYETAAAKPFLDKRRLFRAGVVGDYGTQRPKRYWHGAAIWRLAVRTTISPDAVNTFGTQVYPQIAQLSSVLFATISDNFFVVSVNNIVCWPGFSLRQHRVLVTGATGYIGGRVVPRLLDAGYSVRCVARNAARLDGRYPTTGELRDFSERDRVAALCFGRVARECGVQRIAYLGGLGEEDTELSHHLRSRHDVGTALRQSRVQTN
jgi:NAD-dependent epimerase/dehydratase family protein